MFKGAVFYMTGMHYFGAGIVLLFISSIGLYSGRQVKTAKDFSNGGRKTGVGIVAGSIIGTLVGGASTIGTAQLAFTYGFSAWWFTLGGGIGCLVLSSFFAKPLYESGISTLPQVFLKEYGKRASIIAALLTSLGSFLSIVSQILAGIALVTSVSNLSPTVATIIIIVMMMVYVVFGGVWGAGFVGIAKTILLYSAIGMCGVIAINLQGGVAAFKAALPAKQYFSLIARGASVDIGSGLSLVLGILTTQAYIQAVVSARTFKISRRGILLSALLIPLIGIAGIFVGMYMKLNYPKILPASALPIFILEKTPPVFAGMIMATLLVALMGTGAGVALGLSSMFCNDIYKAFFNKDADDKKMLAMSRLMIVVILLAAALFTIGNMGSLILGWSFLSMALRGAVAFGALCTALFFPGSISEEYAISSMIVGPLIVLIGRFILPPTINPLFLGVGFSIIIIIVGYFTRNKEVEVLK